MSEVYLFEPLARGQAYPNLLLNVSQCNVSCSKSALNSVPSSLSLAPFFCLSPFFSYLPHLLVSHIMLYSIANFRSEDSSVKVHMLRATDVPNKALTVVF